MFNKLLDLYKKHSDKTPLEDFTTEIFVGVLQNNEKFRFDFCNNFLGLKSKYYSINSQGKYYLQGNPNCIVDIIIEGDEEICFVENKVNSKEGYNQLERYSLVLDNFSSSNYKTKLVYCTKKDEPKDLKKHEFLQTKWHKIASFAKKYQDDKLIKLFINFLNKNNMNTDMTLKSLDLTTMENFSRVFIIMNEYLVRLKPEFEKIFGKSEKKIGTNFLMEQIEHHNRLCVYKENVLKGDGYSEILFGFDLGGRLNVHVYVHENHKGYEDFVNVAKDYPNTSFIQHETGAALFWDTNLALYINDENSESKIEKCFIDSFNQLKKIIDSTKDHLNWNL